jgi:hypothetical protein
MFSVSTFDVTRTSEGWIQFTNQCGFSETVEPSLIKLPKWHVELLEDFTFEMKKEKKVKIGGCTIFHLVKYCEGYSRSEIDRSDNELRCYSNEYGFDLDNLTAIRETVSAVMGSRGAALIREYLEQHKREHGY